MNNIQTHNPENIVAESAARHFAILIINANGRCMYWAGNGFELFDDSQSAFSDIKLWRAEDAPKAYYAALNMARSHELHAASQLQIVPIPLMPFGTF